MVEKRVLAHTNLIVGSTCGAGRAWLFFFPFEERGKGREGKGHSSAGNLGLASSGRSVLTPGYAKPTSKGETLTIILARLLEGQRLASVSLA